MFVPSSLSSFLSCFLCLSYPMLGHLLPRFHYWLKKTTLQRLFINGLACGFWLSPTKDISLEGKSGFQPDTMWYDREYAACHIGDIGVLWVRFILLPPPAGYVWDATCTANLHWVGVVVIQIWINWPPVLWILRRWIQIEPGGRKFACCPITSPRCHFCHILSLKYCLSSLDRSYGSKDDWPEP